MGCGTSKSSQVDESVITIIPHPDDHCPSNDESVSEELRDVTVKMSTNDDGVDNELEKQIQDLTIRQSEDSRHVESHSIHPSNTEEVPKHAPQVTDDNNEHENINKYPKSVAFDVPLNNGISSIERKPYPRRLEKLENSPMITKEQIDDKQRAVSERKQKEMDKRRESKRVSKFRREVFDARDSQTSREIFEEVEHKLSIRTRNQSHYGNENYSISGEMEVDSTYNVDNEEDVWDIQEQSSNEDQT